MIITRAGTPATALGLAYPGQSAVVNERLVAFGEGSF